MATYKVPQDVEADDKLIGPFSFRQFIYLIMVALAIAAAWGLFQLLPILVIIPLPIIVFFGALALPLRKDQPMEVYLAALVSFYLKPRRRFWDSDGIETLIEITVPKTIEVQRTKNISQNEAQQRFGYLAEIVDSEGWAVRGQGVQAPSNTAMNADAYFAAQQAEDILDSNYGVAQSLDYMIGQSDTKRREEMMERMRQIPNEPAVDAAPPTDDVTTAVTPQPVAPTPQVFSSEAPSAAYTFFASQKPQGDLDTTDYTPYPASMQQKIIQPLDPGLTTSGKPLSAGIMNLANDADLSIETIAHEANRINQQNGSADEVVVSLR